MSKSLKPNCKSDLEGMQKTLNFVSKQAVHICLFGWLDSSAELGIYQRPVMPCILKKVMEKRKHSAPQ